MKLEKDDGYFGIFFFIFDIWFFIGFRIRLVVSKLSDLFVFIVSMKLKLVFFRDV